MEPEQIFELHDDIVKRLSILHDVIYDRVDRLFKEYNLCNINNGKCLEGDFCCSGCTHLGPDGCTVKSLACKLSICRIAEDFAREHNREVIEEVRMLRNLAQMHSIARFRASKESTFGYFTIDKRK